jgi:ribosome-binding protein aMBF1 (putative translation factor)
MSAAQERLGKRIKRAREAKGLSLRGLADILSIDHALLFRIETAAIDPKWSLVSRLEKTLDLDLRSASRGNQ